MRQKTIFKLRRVFACLLVFGGTAGFLLFNQSNWSYDFTSASDSSASSASSSTADSSASSDFTSAADSSEDDLAVNVLATLEVKGRAPKTNYDRTEFYTTWPTVDGCSLRQKIIKREFGDTAVLDGCDVISGEFYEPYTGKILTFSEKSAISKGIQIDHVVALSDAWQKGAQYMDKDTRFALATDPLNLLAVDSSANQQKSDGDAATWLPSNKSFRCEYVARQISVKAKYGLWVTEAERDAMSRILATCPEQPSYK